jgi:hypothetical protein
MLMGEIVDELIISNPGLRYDGWGHKLIEHLEVDITGFVVPGPLTNLYLYLPWHDLSKRELLETAVQTHRVPGVANHKRCVQ